MKQPGFNKYIHTKYTWKVQCHEIFCSWFISWISFPPSSWVYHLGRFEFFQKFAEIFAAQCWPPVSTTPAANFATSFTSVVDTRDKFATGYNNTGGKFAAGVNNIGGKLPPVSTTPAAKTTGLISGCRYLKVNLKVKINTYVNSTIQRCYNKIIKIFLIKDLFFSFATSVNDTGGLPWAANIPANFRKNSKRP
jgi:hypothetical protein